MVEFKRILVPLDGSDLAEQALPAAEALAEKFAGELILLRVLEFPTPTAARLHLEDVLTLVEALHDRERAGAQRYLDALADRLESSGGKRPRLLMRTTAPAEDILDVAASESIDLIVMATHGRGGLGRWTFGSVADKVVRSSVCPVMLVRPLPAAA